MANHSPFYFSRSEKKILLLLHRFLLLRMNVAFSTWGHDVQVSSTRKMDSGTAVSRLRRRRTRGVHPGMDVDSSYPKALPGTVGHLSRPGMTRDRAWHQRRLGIRRGTLDSFCHMTQSSLALKHLGRQCLHPTNQQLKTTRWL